VYFVVVKYRILGGPRSAKNLRIGWEGGIPCLPVVRYAQRSLKYTRSMSVPSCHGGISFAAINEPFLRAVFVDQSRTDVAMWLAVDPPVSEYRSTKPLLSRQKASVSS